MLGGVSAQNIAISITYRIYSSGRLPAYETARTEFHGNRGPEQILEPSAAEWQYFTRAAGALALHNQGIRQPIEMGWLDILGFVPQNRF
jgi:hypothetical protein